MCGFIALFQIPVVPQADWPAPTKQNNSCTNVVRKVSRNALFMNL